MAQNPELYENHGDHIEALMPTQEFIKLLPDFMKESQLATKVKTIVSLEGYENQESEAFILNYGNRDRTIAILVAYNPAENTNEFVSAYPVFFDGRTYNVTIEKVVEWSNHLEATVYATIGDFGFAFFPTDYIEKKDTYMPGNMVSVKLSALAMRAEEAEKGFEFTGEKALSFLAKIGQSPKYDESGNIEPVKFSTANMVAYLASDDKCPDEAQFQSPVTKVNSFRFLGVGFWECDIVVHRDDESEGDIVVPLYFRRDFVSHLHDEDPIRGWLWMMGEISSSK